MKLSKKLTLAFLSLIFVSIIIIIFISNTMINNRFESYLISEREERFKTISSEINKLYIENDFTLDEMELVHYALTENINIMVKDIEGKTLYDTGIQIGMGTKGNMHKKHRGKMYSHNIGNYAEKIYPLTSGQDNVGSVVIGYIDNAHLTSGAMIFKSTLFKSLLISSFITIIIGFISSIILSKRLTNPLIDIRNTANKIQSGDLKAQTTIKTDIIEIQELSKSLDYLANTLAQQEAIRNRYASDISHELRTPLTTLRSHLEAIVDGVWEPSKEHLEILMTETKHLSNLIDDLKDSFTQEKYNLQLNRTRFNISEELSNIISTFIPLYNQNNFHIRYSIEDNIEIYMDIDKFRQIMNNLLSNSLRYLKEYGEVYIKMISSRDKIILEISDNGLGIRKENLPFVFDRFYRIDNSRHKTTGGTGLGLSIVKSIVDAHDASISVSSIYGQGTKFTIKFPK